MSYLNAYLRILNVEKQMKLNVRKIKSNAYVKIPNIKQKSIRESMCCIYLSTIVNSVI